MYAPADMRKISMAMVITIAMVSVLLPVCMMLGCGMGASGTTDSHSHGLGFNSECTTTMLSNAQAAIAPGNLQSLILMLVAAIGAAFVLTAPQVSMRLVRVAAEDPPPPPEDPRGARFIV